MMRLLQALLSPGLLVSFFTRLGLLYIEQCPCTFGAF